MQTELNTQNVTAQKTSTSTLLSNFDEGFLFKNALILVDHGDYDLAINLLDTILQENEYHQESLKWKGYCHGQLGHIEKSIQSFFKLAEIYPTETNLFHLAEAFYTAGQDDLAKEFYNKSLEKIDYESPHLFQIYKKLGNICTKSQDYEGAEELYDKAFTIIPNSDDLYVNYGTLELQRGRYDLALDRFKHAVNLNQKNDKAWCGLSMIYRLRGDFELAWGDLQQSLDINPKNTVALKLSVDWGLQEMEYEFPLRAMEKFLAIDVPPQVDWIFTYAGLLYHSGDWKECGKVIDIILKAFPDYQAAKDLQKKIDHKANV
jgi:tetratricopeptide (TPR) repeat protein